MEVRMWINKIWILLQLRIGTKSSCYQLWSCKGRVTYFGVFSEWAFWVCPKLCSLTISHTSVLVLLLQLLPLCLP